MSFTSSFLLFFVTPFVALAQQTERVNLLVPDLPIIGATTDLPGLLIGIFRLSLGLAVTAAIIIIVWNGIRYMTTDVVNSKGDAISWIKDALWGLALAFATVLILNTINPQLTQFDFLKTLQEVGGQAGQGSGGGGDDEPPAPPSNEEEIAIRARLRDAGIGVNKPMCNPGQTSNCTNVAGLPPDAITRLIALHDTCACGSFTLTGGTEPGHDTHGVGLPMLDLSRGGNITRFIFDHGTFLRQTPIGKLYSYGGSEFLDETGGTPHWHACMGTQCRFE